MNQSLVLQFYMVGGAEVYLDGKLIAAFGEVGTSAEDEKSVRSTDLWPLQETFSITRTGEYVLAVRHSHFVAPDSYLIGDAVAGFDFVITRASDIDLDTLITIRNQTAVQFAFTFIPLAFALLYFLLFLFYREEKLHLYFALLAASVAAMTFLDLQYNVLGDGNLLVVYRKIFTLAVIFTFTMSARFVYGVFCTRLPIQFWVFLGVVGFLTIWALVNPFHAFRPSIIIGLIMFLEMFRVVSVAIVRKKPGAWLIGTGLLLFLIGTLYDLLLDLRLIEAIGQTTNGYYFGFTGMLVCMAVFLAKDVARTNNELKAQLVEVKRLSEQTLTAEREARKQEVTRLLLEAENERKSQELEDARILQLSMLPDEVPDHDLVEIAVHFQPATEVGGDYYDFSLAEDGTLTIAIGDATGHGMSAGTMVTATKTLFASMAEDDALEHILFKSAGAIRQIGLPKLFMALALVRLRDHAVEFAGAGMPPALIYRAESKQLVSIPLKGVPLGSPGNLPYQTTEITVSRGDSIVLMSDGFPELFNDNREMLGYEKVVSIFEEAASRSPDEIIEHFQRAVLDWADGQTPDDDITFVVLKMK